MKICKNNFDIRLCSNVICKRCVFMIENKCRWIHIINTPLWCGGLTLNSLSDIFTL